MAFTIRNIDEELLNQIDSIAKKESRSRNKQIEYIMRNFVKNYKVKNKEREAKCN